MGLLVVGVPLEWSSAAEFLEYVKKHGVQQFLNVLDTFKDRKNDGFLWGDEVEGQLMIVDKQNKTVRLSLRAPELLKQLQELSHKPLSNKSTDSKQSSDSETNHGNFLPEYGAWMVETTPARPYGGTTADLLLVQHNMRLRRVLINSLLGQNERYLTITAFSGMGVGEFTNPAFPTLGHVALSSYLPDELISPHPRFATLTRNIRKRRGEKVCIRMPLFQDKNTASAAAAEAKTKTTPQAEMGISDSKEIHMDAMGFGMGCCCLQVTFQTRSVEEARHLYDQLAVLAPIMLSLTAATPFLRGKIADTDVRWSVISQSVDDRSRAERNEAPIDAKAAQKWETIEKQANEHHAAQQKEKEKAAAAAATATATATATPAPNTAAAAAPAPQARRPSLEKLAKECHARKVQKIGKSRYDSISTYISQSSRLKDAYNDLELVQNDNTYEALTKAGVDNRLARHIAHLFVRDPLVIYGDKIMLDDSKSTDHFENIQSTNWQTVRFKPPPFAPAPTPAPAPVAADAKDAKAASSNGSSGGGSTAASAAAPSNNGIGWRVEFRSMEIQLTDFENAAFTIFIAVLSRAILYFDLNLYIPISKVDENMKRAHARDSTHTQKFFFRKSIKSCADPAPTATAAAGSGGSGGEDVSCEYEEMTIAEIMCGKILAPEDCGCKVTPPKPAAADKSNAFPGLISLARAYLDLINCDAGTRAVVDRYLTLIEQRANGTLLTLASWYRKFVDTHPSYKHDSNLTPDMIYDITETSAAITAGSVAVPQLLGNLHVVDVYQLARSGGGEAAVADATVPLKGGGDRVFDLNDSNGCKAFYAALQNHVHFHSRSLSANNLAALDQLPLLTPVTVPSAAAGSGGAAGPMSPPAATPPQPAAFK